jgi:hypothetical protein
VAPAREGRALLRGLRAALAVLQRARRHHPAGAEEDDALFNG